MYTDKKKLVNILSILFTLAFMILTLTTLLVLISKSYRREFEVDVLVNYQFLLAIVSMFTGVAIAYLISTFKRMESKGDAFLAESLRENDSLKHQFYAMQDFFHLIIIEIDRDFSVLYTNRGADMLFSKVDDEFKNAIRSIITHEELPDKDIMDVFKGLRDAVDFKFVTKHTKEKDEKVLEGVVKPIYNFADEIYKVQILLRDQTEEIRMSKRISELEDEIILSKMDTESRIEDSLRSNEKLQNSVRILSDTFIAAPTGLIIINSTGGITNCNRAAENLFDFHEKDVIGKNIDTLFTNHEIVQKLLLKAEAGQQVECEVDCLRSDLSHFVGMLQAKPVFDERHDVTRFILSMDDITKRTRLEKHLLLKNQELISVNDIFMSTNEFSSLKKKINVFLDKLFDNLELVRKGLFYLKSDDDTLLLHTYKGFNLNMIEELQRLNVRDSLSGLSLTKNEVILSDIIQPDVAEGFKDMLAEHKISDRHIYLPVIYKGQSLGVLIIFPNKSYNYANEDIEFFNMVRDELGICIKQAQRYEQLRERVTDANDIIDTDTV
ncbi:PAS domain-containing protein [Thermodesulfobacteriota bacterium]